MTIETNYVPDDFTAAAAQTNFAVSFWFRAGELVVYKDDVLQVLGTDYTEVLPVNPTSPNGICSFIVAMDGGENVQIFRGTTFQQTTNFLTSGNLRATDVETALDNLSQQIQEINDKLRLSPKHEIQELANTGDVTMDLGVAGEFLKWGTATNITSASGTPIDDSDLQRGWKDFSGPWIVTSGLGYTGSTLTTDSFATKAYVPNAAGDELVYVEQVAATVGPVSGGDGNYWFAIHEDTTSSVAGWTREGTTKYLWKLSATRPTVPAQTALIGYIAVSSSVFTGSPIYLFVGPRLESVDTNADASRGLFIRNSAPQISLEDTTGTGAANVFATIEFRDSDLTTHGAVGVESGTFIVGDATIPLGALSNGTITLDVVNNVILGFGTGTPESAVTAGVGSLFLRTDGGASTTLYVKESGTGNTGWVAK